MYPTDPATGQTARAARFPVLLSQNPYQCDTTDGNLNGTRAHEIALGSSYYVDPRLPLSRPYACAATGPIRWRFRPVSARGAQAGRCELVPPGRSTDSTAPTGAVGLIGCS